MKKKILTLVAMATIVTMMTACNIASTNNDTVPTVNPTETAGDNTQNTEETPEVVVPTVDPTETPEVVEPTVAPTEAPEVVEPTEAPVVDEPVVEEPTVEPTPVPAEPIEWCPHGHTDATDCYFDMCGCYICGVTYTGFDGEKGILYDHECIMCETCGLGLMFCQGHEVVDDGNNVSVPDYVTEMLALEDGEERYSYAYDLDDMDLDEYDEVLYVTAGWYEDGFDWNTGEGYDPRLEEELGFPGFAVYAFHDSTGKYPTVPYMVHLVYFEERISVTYEEFVEEYGTPDEVLALIEAFYNN